MSKKATIYFGNVVKYFFGFFFGFYMVVIMEHNLTVSVQVFCDDSHIITPEAVFVYNYGMQK